MSTSKRREALLYHAKPTPGKIQVVPTKKYATQRDLSLAYSPGVAEPCLEIAKDIKNVYKYTAKGNLVAVITNGTAVLGLGDIGPEASKPVMEGKGVLFKIFADIDVFDIEINETDPEKFVQIVKALEPTFGGINLEDIKAPECFYIEQKLKEQLKIPVMHDDQHGTAIISAAALINACELQEKKLEEVTIVINGAGAAATSCASIYLALGVQRENLFMFDSKGLIHEERNNLDGRKKLFTNQHMPVSSSLEEVLVGLGVGHVYVCGAQTNNCVRFTGHGALDRGYDVTLLMDAHTTTDYSFSDQVVPAEVLVRDLNASFSGEELPGRKADAVLVANAFQ